MQRYRRILGVGPNATENEIRKAYKRKAMRMHPDRNKSPNAHERFVELGEAYEYLLALSQGRLRQRAPHKEQQGPDRSSGRAYDNWVRKEREAARERARQKARMRYEEYVKSDEFKTLDAADTLINWFGFFIVFVLVSIGCTALVVAVLGDDYYLAGPVGGVFLSAYLFKKLLPNVDLNLKRSLLKMKHLFKLETGQLIFLSYLNLRLFFAYGLNTDLNHWGLIALFIGITALAFTKSGKKRAAFIVLLPFVFNLFFVVNDLFSTAPYKEVYEIDKREFYKNPTTLIPLKTDAYKDAFGLRLFRSLDQVSGNSKLELEFEEGLFGINTLQDYRFM